MYKITFYIYLKYRYSTYRVFVYFLKSNVQLTSGGKDCNERYPPKERYVLMIQDSVVTDLYDGHGGDLTKILFFHLKQKNKKEKTLNNAGKFELQPVSR